MSADTSILPSELITTPQPLIGLSGLDVDKNPIHKSILESFINNRKPDRLVFFYQQPRFPYNDVLNTI